MITTIWNNIFIRQCVVDPGGHPRTGVNLGHLESLPDRFGVEDAGGSRLCDVNVGELLVNYESGEAMIRNKEGMLRRQSFSMRVGELCF